MVGDTIRGLKSEKQKSMVGDSARGLKSEKTGRDDRRQCKAF